MNCHIVLVILLEYAFCYPDYNNATSEPIVMSPLGQIKGTVMTSRLGRTIYAFRGMRYAKAPINELRFKPPVPVEKWDGVCNATEDGPLCPQPSTDPVSEDCLTLNVYTNKLPSGSVEIKRPVMIYIHSGAFYSMGASSSWAGPQYLLDHDVILVTFNYRLGTLGFLSTGDKEAPGNNGLKDQVEAMMWVQKNIKSFGGDPDSVTIMGYGAGATSVVLHMVSPMSKGLFHKAIAMSGSPLGPLPIPHNQMNIAKRQAKFVGCPDDSASNIIKCLRNKSYNELGESLPKFKVAGVLDSPKVITSNYHNSVPITNAIFSDLSDPYSPEFGNDPIQIWSPVIEAELGQPRFLPAHPMNLIMSGLFKKVPFLTGQTTDELGQRAFAVIYNETLKKEMNNNFDKVAPIAFLYERDNDHSKMVSKEIKSLYLQDKPVDKSQLSALAQLYSDAVVGFAVNRAAKLISQHSNQSVYYYRFGYQGRFSHFYTPDSNNTTPYGVVHHDDLIYLFYIQKLFPLFKDNAEVEMVTKLTSLFTNFATTGNPIPITSEKLDNAKWETFNYKDQKFLEIGNKLVMHEKLYEKRFSEWEKLFPLSFYQKNENSH